MDTQPSSKARDQPDTEMESLVNRNIGPFYGRLSFVFEGA